MLKAKITETEKSKSNSSLSDEEVIKVITGMTKQRRQSIEEFEKGKRNDLAEKERAELAVLEEYMPSQMTREEIVLEATKIMEEIGDVGGNRQRLVGQTIGIFNKRFVGRADSATVKSEVERIATEKE